MAKTHERRGVAPVDRLVNIFLRLCQLAFAAIAAGLTGDYLHEIRHGGGYDKGRFVYTEVIAAISILLALLWLIPFSATFIHWPVDLLLFAAWMVSFGLLINFVDDLDCGSYFYWGSGHATCHKWKADVAFAFLSSIFWLLSALLGLWFLRNHRRNNAVAGDGTTTNVGTARSKWYRRY